jgi:hypothetical protein
MFDGGNSDLGDWLRSALGGTPGAPPDLAPHDDQDNKNNKKFEDSMGSG